MNGIMRKAIFIFAIMVILFIGSGQSSVASAEHILPLSDFELAELYSPVLYFHPDEVFRPQTIDVFLTHTRLRKDRQFWFDINLLNDVSQSDLLSNNEDTIFLDVWYGSSGASSYKNYSAHRDFYRENLSPLNGGPPTSIYARVMKDPKNQKTILQYWQFYFYNDWFNKHEGDWEQVSIVLDINLEPEWVVLSQHHGGTRRAWADTKIENGTHPAVYVALGSHANYFWGDEIYPNGVQIGNKRVEILDRTGTSGRIIPEIYLLPTEDLISPPHENLTSIIWLAFKGRWGEVSLQNDFGGPSGPAKKGDVWEQPYTWALEQPLDTLVWYQNRLKILIEENQPAKFYIRAPTDIKVKKFDIGDDHFIYHDEPPQEIILEVSLDSNNDRGLIVSWPSMSTNTIDEITFTSLPPGTDRSFIAHFSKENGKSFVFNGEPIQPTIQLTKNTVWEAPDLVWVAEFLPASQITRGLLLILSASILPTLLYTLAIYWYDRYEKEPIKLLMTTFLWGAIPSVILAIGVELFFNLPPELFSPKALEAIQLGVLSPFVEEALKGAVIIFLARKYREEFHGMMDGIIYGAITGLGFAMTSNLIGYTTSFLYRGFESLGVLIFVEGFLSGLNHAMYSAIFGAGIGLVSTTQRIKHKSLILIAAYFTAVFANSAHSLLRSNILNHPVLGFILNWIGISTIVYVLTNLLNRQRTTIEQFLADELPHKKIKIMLNFRERKNYLKDVKSTIGRKTKKRLVEQFELLTELAFAKKKSLKLHESELERWISSLRDKINELEAETHFIGRKLQVEQGRRD